jgi:hypothetical protein
MAVIPSYKYPTIPYTYEGEYFDPEEFTRYGTTTTIHTVQYIQKRYYTNPTTNQRVEVNVESDGTVKVDIMALELLLEQVGYKISGGTV